MHDDLPPDLPRLEAIETYLLLALDRVREKKAAVQQQEREREQGERARPPAPDWTVERGLNRDALPVAVHTGDCRMAGGRVKPIRREEALRWLAGGVEACTHCRPDSELGFLDG